MLVVVGMPRYRETENGPVVDGLPAYIALTAASLGRRVQMVGKVGEDGAGDAVVLALGKAGVGHVAVLRVAGQPTPGAPPVTDEPVGSDADSLEAESTGRAAARDDAMTLEAADVDLGLRYLTEFSVLVLAEPVSPDVTAVAAAAAGWADARLVVVTAPGAPIPGGLPADAVVFEAPDADPDGAFASMVGAFAAALDDGEEPSAAFRSTVSTEGWTPVEPGDAGDG